MNPIDIPAGSAAAPALPTERAVPELVAQVYTTAPPVERGRLLEQLLRPLGVLSLVAVADGIFAKLRFRSGWQPLQVRLEDIHNITGDHVRALADHAQQVSVETVDGLADLLSHSPVLLGSAAAALLVSLLVQRARARQGDGRNAVGVEARR